jgi:hypothetical protein
MEVLRDLRSFGRLILAVGVGVALCAAPAEAQRRRAEPVVAPGPQWPVKTREHVDLWLHAFALLQEDTAAVPLFNRGYAERMMILKNSRAVYTSLDSARDDLSRIGAERGLLLNAQFIPLYFGTWEEMVQAFDYYFKAEGNPSKATNREVAGIIAFLASNFPRAEDRAWAARFMAALTNEREKFYRQYWLDEFRARSAALAATDSLWQGTWRPALQQYLNHTQQPSGDLILSLVLGGEGRALPAGKSANQFAVPFAATADSAEITLFTFVHEAAGAIAKVAVDDNLTPAQQRAGLGNSYGSAGLIRGGALIVERLLPGMGERYARFYLAQMGKSAPAGSALEALEAAFPMPVEMIDAMKRQIELSFSGI